MVFTHICHPLNTPTGRVSHSTHYLIVLLLAYCFSIPATAGAHKEAQSEADKIAKIIWSKELAIYKARESGDLGVYIANASEHYMGWPPGWPKPSNLDKLRAGAKGMKGMDKERLTMTYGDLTLSEDKTTAIIYYSTHRTSDPTGKVVDQHFEICHVWTLENNEWKLLGALGRTRPEPAGQ